MSNNSSKRDRAKGKKSLDTTDTPGPPRYRHSAHLHQTSIKSTNCPLRKLLPLSVVRCSSIPNGKQETLSKYFKVTREDPGILLFPTCSDVYNQGVKQALLLLTLTCSPLLKVCMIVTESLAC